jgi:hypothetical protein
MRSANALTSRSPSLASRTRPGLRPAPSKVVQVASSCQKSHSILSPHGLGSFSPMASASGGPASGFPPRAAPLPAHFGHDSHSSGCLLLPKPAPAKARTGLVLSARWLQPRAARPRAFPTSGGPPHATRLGRPAHATRLGRPAHATRLGRPAPRAFPTSGFPPRASRLRRPRCQHTSATTRIVQVTYCPDNSHNPTRRSG